MYPLKLKPVYKQTIWGGDKLGEKFGKDKSLSSVGETWELAVHKNGVSTVENGELAGLGIDEVFAKYGNDVIGRKIKKLGEYPLLLKLIDAKGLLSIQVHPTDDYAKKYEGGSLGKTEAWYILEAEEGAFLYIGFKDGIKKEDLERELKKGGRGVLELFNKIYVKRGDVINIPAGMLHAIGEGIVLLEIQENSDITYRVYDYDRLDKDGKGRELHVDKALEVLNFDMTTAKPEEGIVEKHAWGEIHDYISNDYFKLKKIEANKSFVFKNPSYSVLTCIKGAYRMIYSEGSLEVKLGETVLVPFSMDEVDIEILEDSEIILINE